MVAEDYIDSPDEKSLRLVADEQPLKIIVVIFGFAVFGDIGNTLIF